MDKTNKQPANQIAKRYAFIWLIVEQDGIGYYSKTCHVLCDNQTAEEFGKEYASTFLLPFGGECDYDEENDLYVCFDSDTVKIRKCQEISEADYLILTKYVI